jgi:hypothetical protein
MRPVFLPFFLFSLTAEVKDNVINNNAHVRKISLWFFIQFPIATLPKPKLTRISDTCQQNANITADIMAPTLLRILYTY